MSDSLSAFDKDQIAEIVNIGAGNAATAFSHMLGKKVEMNVPSALVGPIEKVQQSLGDSQDKVMTVYLKMYGDIEGGLAIIFKPEAAIKFNQLLSNSDKNSLDQFAEEDISALREVGNILLGASITALCKFLDMNILPSIPDAAIDMLGAAMESILTDISKKEDEILCVSIKLSIEEDGLDSELYYIFDPQSTQKILKHTGQLLAGQGQAS